MSRSSPDSPDLMSLNSPSVLSLPALDWESVDQRWWQHLTRAAWKDLKEAERTLIGRTFPLYAERYLRIKEKADPSDPNKVRKIIPFRLNGVQKRFLRGMTNREIVLKSRKHGFSTLVDALFFHDTVVNFNVTTLIVSKSAKATVELMDSVKLMYNSLPEEVRPAIKYNSKFEMSFPSLNSKFMITTAGEPESMRGGDITNLHCSEAAFWPEPEKLVATLFEAGPPRQIVVETTANGVGGWFYDFWHRAKQGKSTFKPNFYEWMLDPTCRLRLGRGEEIEPEPGLDAEQTKFIHAKRADLGSLAAQEYPMNDIEAFVTTSRSVFDMGALEAYAKVVQTPRWRGDFGRDGRFYESKDGYCKIWAAPDRKHNYVIGADVSEGIDRGDGRTDYSTAVVIDMNDMNIVSTWKGYVDPDLFADELKALGTYFGGVRGHALIGVENNFFGGTTLNSLQKTLRYPWVYYQTSIDKRTNTKTDRLGWRTDSHSKPRMIAELAGLIRDGRLGIPDQTVIEECRTFVRLSQTNGTIMGGETGTHDDLVIAAAIAVMMMIAQPIQRPSGYVETILDPWARAKQDKKDMEGILGGDIELQKDDIAPTWDLE